MNQNYSKVRNQKKKKRFGILRLYQQSNLTHISNRRFKRELQKKRLIK